MKVFRLSVFIAAIVGAVIVVPAQAQWAEPSGTPPGGSVAAPINISNNTQTKAGSFTINPGNFYLGQSGGSSKFCLNADPVADINNTAKCISDWADIGGVGKFVRLNPSSPDSDTGFVSVVGVSNGQYAFKAVAPTANNQYTAGVLAQDTTGFSGTSYAVYAYAGTSNSKAVYAQSDNSQSYAGYFRGLVGIYGTLTVQQGNINLDAGDVLVGTVSNPTQICLYGSGAEDCIDSWQDVVDKLNGELWTEEQIAAGVYNTYLTQTQSNLAIGGNGYDRQTEFFFNVSSGGKFALGLPTASSPISFTCGDGVCNGVETSATCVADCPAGIPQPDVPGNIRSLTASSLGVGRNRLTWQNPSNGTFAGVVFVRAIGAQPSLPPSDGSAYANCQTLGNGIVIKITSGSTNFLDDDSASCSPPVSGVTYYYRGFAYNSIPKYADGVPTGANTNFKTQ